MYKDVNHTFTTHYKTHKNKQTYICACAPIGKITLEPSSMNTRTPTSVIALQSQLLVICRTPR